METSKINMVARHSVYNIMHFLNIWLFMTIFPLDLDYEDFLLKK